MIHDVYVLMDDGDRRVLDTFGLSTLQYAVLVLLDKDRNFRLTSLSKRLLRSKSTITRVVDRLEDAGLVERIVDPDDRRAQRVILTPAGVDLRDRASAAHDQSLEARMAALSEGERQQLDTLLDKLLTGLRTALEAD